MSFSESPFPVLFHSWRVLITPRGSFEQRGGGRRSRARRRDEIRSGANGKFHGEFMTYRNGGRNYRQIRPLTLYEPPKEVNAVTLQIRAGWVPRGRARPRETTAEVRARVAERDVLHSRPPRY